MSSIRSALFLRRGAASARAFALPPAARASLFTPTSRCLWFPNPGATKPKATPTQTSASAAGAAEPEPVQQQQQQPEEDHHVEIPVQTPAAHGAEASPSVAKELDAARRQILELQRDLDISKKRIVDTDEKVTALHESIQDWEQVALRERADAENARRIAREDVASAKTFAIKNFAKDLLEIPDTFVAAIESAKKTGLGEDERGAKFFAGIEQVERVLSRALERHGVKKQPIIPNETIFNPEHHEALTLVPTQGDIHHHTILNVFQSGYALNDRVLRAAKVVVADNPSNPAPTPEKAQ